MGITTYSNLNCTLAWSQVDQQTLTKINDSGRVASDITFTDGSGSGAVNAVWHYSGVLPSGGSVTFDFQALSRTIFEETASIGFSKIRAIIIKNKSETAGEHITVAATGTTPFIDLFSGTGAYVIHPTAALPAANPLHGWTITSSNRKLSIADSSGQGVAYEIAVVGVL